MKTLQDQFRGEREGGVDFPNSGRDVHVTQLCSFNWQALLVRQFPTHYQVIKVGGVISKSERDT